MTRVYWFLIGFLGGLFWWPTFGWSTRFTAKLFERYELEQRFGWIKKKYDYKEQS